MKLKSKNAFILILIIFCLGCAVTKGEDPLETLGQDTYEAVDIAYGSHEEQKMDVYIPKTSGPFPVLVIVHGGGWHWGDKSEEKYFEEYIEMGFAVVNINYRLGDMSFTIEEKLNDIHSAINIVNKYKEYWNITDDLTILGGSAGGHMVLQYGFTLGLDHVDRIVSYCAHTDLKNPFYVNNGIYEFIQALFKSWDPSEEELKKNSPLYSIPEQLGPSVMLIHGNADTVADFKDSQRLHEKLKNVGWDSTLIEIPDVGHDFKGTDWDWVNGIYHPWLKSRVWPNDELKY